MMTNCFTVVINYLNIRYVLPSGWGEYTLDINNMDLFVKNQTSFLAKKQHIGFFKSFCKIVKTAKKDDIVLTRTSVGVAINQFTYWVWSEDLDSVIHKKLDKECLIMRVDYG
jgi:hypothetical protein